MAGGQMRISLKDLPKLPVEQLSAIKKQTDQELSVLNDSLMNLNVAVKRVERAAKALERIGKQSEGQKVLVPLTSSLYVEGQLGSTGKVVVDIGAGYYVEKSIDEGRKYCDQRVQLLLGNQEKVIEVATQKGRLNEEVTSVLQAKISASQSSS